MHQFVAADTSGDQKSAESLVLPLGDGTPFCELATDNYSVTDSVRFVDALVRGDTTLVIVAYHVLGRLWSEDPHSVGPLAGRFQADIHLEVDTFYVLPSPTGRLGIDCDHRQPPNHPSLPQANGWLSTLDAESRAAWDSVTRPNGLR